jgi:hypothetical protein
VVFKRNLDDGEVKKGDGVNDRECAKTALCRGYSPEKGCKEIKIGDITSTLPLLITFSSIRGPGGNVPLAPQCYVMLAFRVLSLCLPGSNHKWAFTRAFLYGRWPLTKRVVKQVVRHMMVFGFLQLVGKVCCKNPKALTAHLMD